MRRAGVASGPVLARLVAHPDARTTPLVAQRIELYTRGEVPWQSLVEGAEAPNV